MPSYDHRSDLLLHGRGFEMMQAAPHRYDRVPVGVIFRVGAFFPKIYASPTKRALHHRHSEKG